MSIDIDIVAMVVVESLGAVSSLVALLFFRQLRKTSGKQRVFLEALNRRAISERSDGKCYSSEWAMDNTVYKRRKLLSATPLLVAIFYFLLAVFYYFVGPIYIIANVVRLGYVAVTALVGIAVLLWTDAFQAYSYINAIQKVATEQLDRADQSYIELARRAMEKASLRFGLLGVAFALFGPLSLRFSMSLFTLLFCIQPFSLKRRRSFLKFHRFSGLLYLS